MSRKESEKLREVERDYASRNYRKNEKQLAQALIRLSPRNDLIESEVINGIRKILDETQK